MNGCVIAKNGESVGNWILWRIKVVAEPHSASLIVVHNDNGDDARGSAPYLTAGLMEHIYKEKLACPAVAKYAGYPYSDESKRMTLFRRFLSLRPGGQPKQTNVASYAHG